MKEYCQEIKKAEQSRDQDLLDLSLAYEHPGPEPNTDVIGREES